MTTAALYRKQAEQLIQTAKAAGKYIEIECRIATAPISVKADGTKIQIEKHTMFGLVESKDDTLLLTLGANKPAEVSQKGYDKLDDGSKLFKTEKLKAPAAKKAPAKAPAKPGMKIVPAKPPETKPVEKVDLWTVWNKIAKGTLPTKEEYEAVPELGLDMKTGRSKNALYGMVMGPAAFRGRICMSLWADDGKILYQPKATDFNVFPWKNGRKESYTLYAAKFREWQAALKKEGDRRNTQRQDADKKTQELRIDYTAEGKDALIKFSNATQWQRIIKVDERAQKIGIQGSGSKLRWISNALVQQLREPAAPARNPSWNASMEKGAKFVATTDIHTPYGFVDAGSTLVVSDSTASQVYFFVQGQKIVYPVNVQVFKASTKPAPASNPVG